MNNEFDKLSYPIGRFEYTDTIFESDLSRAIEDISRLPETLKKLTENLTDFQLQLQYRPNSWKISQIVHHLADSHINAYIRMKLAVTQNEVVINPYAEELWAEMEDVKSLPIGISITLMGALHLRWTIFLKSLDEEKLNFGYVHPANQRFISIKQAILLYAWHCNHHIMHIKIALANKI